MELDKLVKLRYRLADWLLYNHRELLDLVLHEEFGTGVSFGGQGCNDLDSQVERFIESSQYRLYIVNSTQHYLDLLESRHHEVYRLKYEDKKLQDDIARIVRINKNTVTSWVKEIKEGLLDDLEEGGIILNNIYQFKRQYDWVDAKEKMKPPA